jgi:hypothetical protein
MAGVADYVPVTFIWDTTLGSPNDPTLQALGGKQFLVPPDQIPLPTRGRLVGVGGYSRQTAGAWEWVIQGDVDQVDVFVDSLTGRGGWLVPASRQAVKLMIQRMFSAGIPRNTIATQVPQFYQAVVAEIQAELASPPSP